MRRWWIAAGLALAASAAPAVEFDEDVRYYEVTGDSPARLWADMRANGPTGLDGRRYNATTRWDVHWRYPIARTAAGCATGPVTVHLAVLYTLPHWDRSSNGASAIVASQWNRYIEALIRHEEGHADFGRQTARRIELALEAIPPQASCEDLQEAANAAGLRVLEEARPQERKYDRRTRHGATQGTEFFRELAEEKSPRQ